jgi:hypothetical protein
MPRAESNTLYITKKIIILASVTVKHPDKEQSLLMDIFLHFVFIKVEEFFISLPDLLNLKLKIEFTLCNLP